MLQRRSNRSQHGGLISVTGPLYANRKTLRRDATKSL